MSKVIEKTTDELPKYIRRLSGGTYEARKMINGRTIRVSGKNLTEVMLEFEFKIETPILEGVANREYYGRSATSIENKSTIEYGTEQGLAALIYGEQGVSSLPIQDITGEYIDTDNEYMYYYSAEFVK